MKLKLGKFVLKDWKRYFTNSICYTRYVETVFNFNGIDAVNIILTDNIWRIKSTYYRNTINNESLIKLKSLLDKELGKFDSVQKAKDAADQHIIRIDSIIELL